MVEQVQILEMATMTETATMAQVQTVFIRRRHLGASTEWYSPRRIPRNREFYDY